MLFAILDHSLLLWSTSILRPQQEAERTGQPPYVLVLFKALKDAANHQE